MTEGEAIAYAAGYGDASDDYIARAAEREVGAYAQGLADAAGQAAEGDRDAYRAGYVDAVADRAARRQACPPSARRRPLRGPGRREGIR